MKQYSKLFRKSCLSDDGTSVQLNDFLRKNPNYVVDKVSFENHKGTCVENLFVVFRIEE